jgi:hypothetical protein
MGKNTNTVTVKYAYAATRQSITLLLRQLPLLPIRIAKANVDLKLSPRTVTATTRTTTAAVTGITAIAVELMGRSISTATANFANVLILP